jgi:PAS domain S-box-containing protein
MSGLTGLAMALVAPGLAFGMRHLPGPDLGPPYLLFCPPILLAAMLGGPWSGILSTALSAVLAADWVLHAERSTSGMSPGDAVSLAAFVLSGLLVSLLAHLYGSARDRAATSERAAALRETSARLADSEERLQRTRQDAHMSAAQLAAVIHAVQDGISLADRSGHFILVNAALARIHGFASSEDGWRSVEAAARDLELCELDGRPVPKEGWPTARVLRGESFVEWELRARRRDTGRERIFSYSGEPIRRDGTVELALLATRDITERKQAALRLDAERQRLAVTLQSIGDAVIATDVSGRVTGFNTVAERLTGWSAAEAVGHPLSEVFRVLSEETGQAVEDPAARVLREGAVAGVADHTVLLARDGVRRPIAQSGAPIRGADGAILGVVLVFRDRSAERRTDLVRQEHEARLAKSEARYRLLADHAHDVIWTLDLRSGRYTYVSPSIQGLRGLSVEEALAEPIEESLTPESLARVRAVMSRIGTPEESDPHTEVFDQPCRDGVVKHVEITTKLVRDEAGRAVEVVGVSRDATARVRAERALEVRERHLRTVLETALEAFWVVDDEGRILEVNEAACSISGYPRAELVGLSVADLSARDDPEQIRRRIDFIRRQGSDRFESRHRCKDGRLVDVELSVQRAELDGGTMVCFLRDLTAEKRSREALRRSEERFRALIEKSTDMVQVLDGEGRITFWSPSTTETLGWREDEAVGRHALDWVHPEDRERFSALLTQLLARPGGRERALLRHRHADGSWRHVETQARNLLDDPAVRGVVVNSRDVSEQLTLEQQLRQAQKLESVGRLAGGVAHDFNNLLTVILAGVEELRSAPRDQAAPAEIVDEIGAAGDRARELTQQLLAFARKQVITPVSLDLSAVVQGTEKLLARLLGEDIVLTTRLAPDLWAVRCDRGQVEQIIVNLAVNARDAMPAGGQLSLETSNVELTGDASGARAGLRPGRWARLAVRDDGEGMAPEVRERIFEPFFTTKEKGKGTGLGLSTVYGIVTQSDGFVQVDSEPGRGTTFEIFLPAAATEAPAAAPPSAHASRRGTETVLVVEDDAQVRAITVRALRSAGYRVLVAADGREALALSSLEPHPVHLLVTDMVMPGLGGKAVAEQLTAARPGLRVLYVSGYTQDVIDQHGVIEAGVELLSKPFTPGVLLARVRAVLDGAVPPVGG